MPSEKTIKKNILLVIRHPVGGIKTYLKYVYKSRYFDKYRFTIVLPENNLKNNSLGTVEEHEVSLVECNNDVSSLTICLYKTLKSKQFDLVHSHGFTSGACAALLAGIFSTPHLMTSHDVILDKQFSGKTGFIKKKLITFLFNRIDVIQSVTQDAQDNFNSMLPDVIRPGKVMIFNGIDISLYTKNEKRDFRSELGLAENCFLIGFLGRFMSQKGFKYLVEAIENIYHQGKLEKTPVVLSFGSDGFIREEKEKISQKNLDRMFRFLPQVDNVAPVINGLDVVAMPSLWEACGLLGMETLISGKPLIASNCIGLREVIDGSPAFVIKPADSQSLLKAINMSMKDDRSVEFESFAVRAQEKFTAENTSRQLAELYLNMLDSSKTA